MNTFSGHFTFLFRVTAVLVTLILNSACVTEQFKYLEIQQQMDLTSQHIQQKEKTIRDLEAFIGLNQKAVETLENGGTMMINGKTISLSEARQNIQNAQALLPAMRSEWERLIEKKKSLQMNIRQQTTTNSSLI